jgi:hypothetical protein
LLALKLPLVWLLSLPAFWKLNQSCQRHCKINSWLLLQLLRLLRLLLRLLRLLWLLLQLLLSRCNCSKQGLSLFLASLKDSDFDFIRLLLVQLPHLTHTSLSFSCFLKGSLTRDFLLQVYFMNQFRLGPKYEEIFKTL